MADEVPERIGIFTGRSPVELLVRQTIGPLEDFAQDALILLPDRLCFGTHFRLSFSLH